jgi:hypothetical protein
MSIDGAVFGWHATIFLGRWLFLVAGLAVVAVAVVIAWLWWYYRPTIERVGSGP